MVLTIDRIAAGGDGVGRAADGRVVFVPTTAPGDRVRIVETRDGGRWLRGEVREVVEESPDRREPPCEFFDRCGGCQLQHIDYPAQLRAKSAIIGDALRRIGGREVADPEVEASDEEFRYRQVMSFSLRRLSGRRVVAGLRERRRPGRIVDIHDECLLPEPSMSRVWSGVRAHWGAGAARLPRGRELRLTLRTVGEGAVLFVDGGAIGGDPTGLVADVDGLFAIWGRRDEGEWTLLAGDEAQFVEASGERIRVAPGAFSQVHRSMADALRRSVLEQVGPAPGQRVVDAYCGSAVHGRRLARDGAEVVGIELDARAVASAREGAPDGFSVVHARVEDALPGVLPADQVVLNPPRRGLDAQVCDVLRERPVGRIVYISCDPATLARDLKRLGPEYTIRRVQGFDLFPQTSHVESVVTLDHSLLPTP